MAYVKKTWKTGDIITAEDLNHIENGFDGLNDITGEIVFNVDEQDNITCNKTYSEIKNLVDLNLSTWATAFFSGIYSGSFMAFEATPDYVSFRATSPFMVLTEYEGTPVVEYELGIIKVNSDDTIILDSEHAYLSVYQEQNLS